MHELSIALSILEVAEEEAMRRCDVRVVAIHLNLGPLSGVVKEALLASFERAREGTAFETCRLIVEEFPVRVFCPQCHCERPVVSLQEIRCLTCGEPTPHIVSGRQLEVAALEIQDAASSSDDRHSR